MTKLNYDSFGSVSSISFVASTYSHSNAKTKTLAYEAKYN